ncbi:hypothetical protein KC332_g17664 [Hortaea werneckii]|uniref:RRM domain-containing protein n=2 Tax=Hortaea werneckii TaxID=91943 RepID=A0A3M7I434_HORWE|nr:hypothetical protein KC358_g17746 [Hortaea werneckii]OTA28960.1 hypothetical protein BTJ68_09241 [Hortaea werneckii EXF-2000]KAI6792536.1 hypothetical protein KC350_g17573 [Hortaea werneckii]KAI6897832.1 hypothetical protein KC348_g17623 [Hortaea werneckii]KAI6918867.1 hypothetical protein KC341_g17655 [Hortaea werneckii]
MSRTAISRSNNVGPYFLTIEGLPKEYTWQDLKDLIRGEASHGIWTDMHIHPNGKAGGKGHARVQREDEARKLYRYLTTNLIERRKLRVHLWDISDPAKERFLCCNCESPAFHSAQNYQAQGLEVVQMAALPGWQAMQPVSSMPASPASYSMSPATTYSQRPAPAPNPTLALTATTQAALVHAMSNMQISSQDPRLQDPRWIAYFQQQYTQAARAQTTASQQQSRLPVYTMSPSGTPINMTHGHVKTEARGIFVSGLNFDARAKEVEALFSQAGPITKCDLPKNPSTGKLKGNAMIQYASAASAQKAIDMFHKQMYMSMELRVRRDKEAIPVSSPPSAAQARKNAEPIIVNGSRTRNDSVVSS